MVTARHLALASQRECSATSQVYLTVTINAPVAGFVVLTGNVIFVSRLNSASATETGHAMMSATLAHDQNVTTNSATATIVTLRILTGARAAAPVSHTFPVDAGVQTFRVRVALSSAGTITDGPSAGIGGCLADARTGTIDALYVPFGYDGAPTLAP